ncbi:Virulence activator alpha C-term [Parafrankia irregularis]|uniref:Virulence activator alpha C-term n=1 Tax=Parafrankia irregularis TaxID=795642 RepID=A0A0S4QFU1_9ACTN|nr:MULTISPECIES: PadR family transcriptional regulator [Parafrankia]MBE3199735.1 PadR family transcriptional regulator [Parafrankia sp. CH37]CUU53592.1 Virulence activator alpha C-term [Parafrankia irregularis]
MSVRNGLLALLAERPMYGYQLRAEFEARTGSTWPLNIGQVYTTLRRLERDGLVVGERAPSRADPTDPNAAATDGTAADASAAERPGTRTPAPSAVAADAPVTAAPVARTAVINPEHGDGDSGDGRGIVYRLTAAGAAEALRWWSTPVSRRMAGRDELAIKLALAVTLPEVDVRSLLQRQRVETLRAMQEYTRLRQPADDSADLAWLLVLENLIFTAEAEIRWLDHVELRLIRHRTGAPTGPDREDIR